MNTAHDRRWLRRGLAVLSLAGALAAPGLLTAPVQAQTSDATGFFEGPDFSSASGPQIYTTICQGCHMAKGEGAKGGGEYPALADNPKLAAGPYVAMMVLDGNGAMPGFRGMLTDKQVVEIADYVRTHFGNSYSDPLSLEDVKALRGVNVAAHDDTD
ncbi:c-type cytochrome [Pseudoxanthomonas composti]|uniref:C-type cytochrome n=1 Tax=Pseudoxanthomonas composti TaxID=2137479 RepID=A0A4V1N1M3_9GAMM|nr:cytochrome c [Pseudoxanthomonas composti]RXR08798.1 c-type cytochrome [Pseudoxanthomonas composti]